MGSPPPLIATLPCSALDLRPPYPHLIAKRPTRECAVTDITVVFGTFVMPRCRSHLSGSLSSPSCNVRLTYAYDMRTLEQPPAVSGHGRMKIMRSAGWLTASLSTQILRFLLRPPRYARSRNPTGWTQVWRTRTCPFRRVGAHQTLLNAML